MEPGHVAGVARARHAQVRVALHVQVEPHEAAQEVELRLDDAMSEASIPVAGREVVVHTFVDRIVGDVLVVVVETLQGGRRPGAQPRQQLVADVAHDRGLVQIDDHPAARHEVLRRGHLADHGDRGVT